MILSCSREKKGVRLFCLSPLVMFMLMLCGSCGFKRIIQFSGKELVKRK